MKPRHIAIVLLIGLAAIAVWWFMEPAPAITAKPAAAPSSKPAPSIALAPPAPSQMPVVVTLAPAPSSPQPDAADPHAAALVKLRASIADQISLLEANDFDDYTRKYAQQKDKAKTYATLQKLYAQFLTTRGQPTPPQQTQEEAEQGADQVEQYVDRAELDALLSIKDLTPKINQAGNQAVYSIDPTVLATMPLHSATIYFHLKDGRWIPGPGNIDPSAP